MSAVAKKRRPSFSLRLSEEERARPETAAGSMPLGAYIKSVLFAEDAPTYRKRKRGPDVDRTACARVLAKLGESGLSESLSDLAAAARIGALPVDEALEGDLRAACAEIAALRVLLMRGLGVDEARAACPDLFSPKDAP